MPSPTSRTADTAGAPIPLDPRSPLVLDTHELGRRPGSMVKVAREVPAPADLGTAFVSLPEGSPLRLDLRLESVMEGVLVSGTVRGTAAGQCGRCLTDFEQLVEVDVQELFAYPGKRRADDPDDPEQDELREIEADLVDLEPAVRDAVVPTLPFQPVCRPDCPGLCSECGAQLADDPEHQHDVVDPRWSALQGLALVEDQATDDRREPAGSRTDAQEEN